MKTSHHAQFVLGLRVWAGRLAVLLLVSMVFWLAVGFGRNLAPRGVSKVNSPEVVLHLTAGAVGQ